MRMSMITMPMTMNVINDDENGYVKSPTYPKGFDEYFIGTSTCSL